MTYQPETHGPMKIVNVGENVWGGQLTISNGDTVPTTDFSGLTTKVFRSTARFVVGGNNNAGGLLIANAATGFALVVITNGTLRVQHARPATDALISFMAFIGGTNIT